MATIAQVALFAGVSTATVSRALNKPDVVDEKTKAKVREAVDALGYRPNQVARGLASRSSRTVGVVINRFDSAYYGQMMQGAEKGLRSVGYKTIAESTCEHADGERAAWNSLLDRQCEAIILHADALSDDELRELYKARRNTVLMNRYHPDFADRCVYLDNIKGGQLAGEYLLSKGHRSIATITGPSSYYEARDRLTGLRQSLANAGIELDPALVEEGNFRDDMGFTCMNRLIDSGKTLSAVFCQSDEMAAGALDACRQRGVRVPEDISVLGFDGLDLAYHLTPKLTTVRQPLREIGEAAGLLAYAVATKSTDHSDIKRIFAAEVVERSSVRDLNDGS
ncbi:transcriptional regulator [Pseudovibrio japonicus]|uniref:Transcriptional regulator n=1 Tax=Pseudovibrio japonicus TaxID=366534 RepID=A0ABQ3EJJ2_9HYPH|nr:LacI family DNA-binding transcriptional regulator [Pseudovibrio japonicus]GHB42977.1 transcriptional regulator [Pseudovibrio japonicus]